MATALKSPRRAMQLMLFRSARNEPTWESVPIEIRQQVLHLLVRMLRDRVAHQSSRPAAQEHGDE